MKSGTYQELHNDIKGIYTIRQNASKKGRIEKNASCKNNNCLAKAKIVLYGGSLEQCDFLINQHNHLPACNTLKDPFSEQSLFFLCALDLKPTFNKKATTQIIDNIENRRRISNIKYALKSKERLLDPICDINDLKLWLEERCIKKFNLSDIKSIDWNLPIVTDFLIEGDSFIFLSRRKI